MFEQSVDFSDYHNNKSAYYQSMCEQLKGLLSIETNAVTNMAQVSAFIYQSIPNLNWAGFYTRQHDSGLILGPYQGRVACVHIPFGRGVCGTVAQSQQSIRVDDVHAFDGHIACDAASNSEIVVPIVIEDTLYGVLDIDSPIKNRFDDTDLAGFESLVAVFKESTRLC